jgi:Fur family zinc uptake transcriptional regulator
MLHTNHETSTSLNEPHTSPELAGLLRLTRNQRMVLDVLAGLNRSAGAYELLDLLKPEGVKAIPTIYRALNELEEKGLVRHLASTKSFVAVSDRLDTEQQKVMLVCEQCRSVTPIHDAGTVNALTNNAQTAGFTVQSRYLELVGTCTNCSRQ